jgi:hypothetical protein
MDIVGKPGDGNSKSISQSGFLCPYLQELSNVRFRTKQFRQNLENAGIVARD